MMIFIRYLNQPVLRFKGRSVHETTMQDPAFSYHPSAGCFWQGLNRSFSRIASKTGAPKVLAEVDRQ
jgi:hypothetical protein